METDNRSLYEKSVQDRNTLRYIIGLIVRWKQNLKYVRARRIARKRGATIGEGVVMPVSLAKRMNKNVTIGDHTSIQTTNISSFTWPLTIGSHVVIGSNVKIVMGSHNIESPEWENYRPNPGLTIEDYVWLCPDSVVLPAVQRIGYGAVVGANAVVVKDVSTKAIMGGNPAKELKQRKCVHSNLVVESLLGGDYEVYRKIRKMK